MSDNKKQSNIYLLLVLRTCFVLGIIALLTRNDNGNITYQILQKGFTAFPVLAAIITRWITKDRTPWKLSIKIWKQPKLWIFCAFVPGNFIALGAIFYFILFPNEYSGSFHYSGLLAFAGVESSGVLQVNSPIMFTFTTVLLSATFNSAFGTWGGDWVA